MTRIPAFDSPEFDAILAEAWDNANTYSYEGSWGVRIRSASLKAQVENLIVESKEMRARLLVHTALELALAWAEGEDGA